MMEKADPVVQKVYNRMRLWEFPEQYLVEPSDGSSAPFLAISRYNGSFSIIDELPQLSSHRAPKIWTIFGVVGTLKLFAGIYLLVITERESAGTYVDKPIFRISSMKIFPCDLSLKHAPEEHNRMEREFSQLLYIAETTPGLYFSYEVNLTLSLQRLHDLSEESKLLPLWRQADPRFLWNSYMSELLIDNKLDPYLLPVMQGSFKSFQYALGENILDVTLIARRCNRRTGTRMWTRGADSDGFVANFIETEQIIQLNGHIASFIQVRGSIPLLWDQIVDLTYKPKFFIMDIEPHVVEKHFQDLNKKYGNVLAVNLVNKHGDEGRLCEQFGFAMQHIASEKVRYRHFDFHKICGELYIEWLSILYYQIEIFLYKNRYFLLNDKGEKVEKQIGVVRTNCIDCLDRTNVTQSMIARKTLESQLRRLGVFHIDETIRMHPQLDECFKNLWANHGDDISIQYTGTPALKGDFVRFGKRTFCGIVKDGWISLVRYYLNNFCDGTKQDAIDLLHGHFSASGWLVVTPAMRNGSVEAMASFPMAFSAILSGIFYAMLSLIRVVDEHDPWNIIISMMWGGMSYLVAMLVKANAPFFCDRPRLNRPRL
ncbi:phosphoinositide phosphatase SAC6-like isoform X2 [Salvia miltiorrhiza]|uniref:phosphoinositide phosphatase SAC6-like isoform X2 n=1 Tax=Salvia miltiorrhiza TaxID=226208 RepID=UPI0025ACF6DC|nr:phosphoinositide phosphatase SAC6-like isoform X2 [Salvia miltiorrhiza]